MTRIGIAISSNSPADNLHGIEAAIFIVGFVVSLILFVLLCAAIVGGLVELVKYVLIGRVAVREEKGLRKLNEEYLDRLDAMRKENDKLRSEIERLRADERGDYDWYLARTPLSREAYVERRRVLERSRAEIMNALKYNPDAPAHMRQANSMAIEKIDKQLLALAERIPADMTLDPYANDNDNDGSNHPRTETDR